MTVNRNADSKYPDFIIGVGFFSWDCDRLMKLRRAIQQWQEKARSDLTNSRERLDAQYTDDEGQDYLTDWHAEEESRVRETVRIMYAGLAVAIASHVESCFGFFCERCKVELVGKPDWGEKRRQLERVIGSLASVDGLNEATRVRLLGNCYKHKDGKFNNDFVKKFGGTEGEEIAFENEPWDEIINNVATFLHEVFKMARHHWA